MAELRVTYDPDADAAYLYLRRRIGPGGVGRTIEAEGMPCTIVLDFDADDRLIGVEVLGARRHLPEELLADAVPPGQGAG